MPSLQLGDVNASQVPPPPPPISVIKSKFDASPFGLMIGWLESVWVVSRSVTACFFYK